MTVSLLYVALFLLGAGVGLAYGYGAQEALFESVSAGASVGLSVGITDPSMPAGVEAHVHGADVGGTSRVRCGVRFARVCLCVVEGEVT